MIKHYRPKPCVVDGRMFTPASPAQQVCSPECKQALLTRPLTAKRLRELLKYNAETGEFTRLQRQGREPAGAVAGSLQKKSGYWEIGVDSVSYYAHRLAWFWVLGEWPPFDVDHEDLDRTNNSFLNLRFATRGQNMANGSLRSDNTSRVKGVHYSEHRHAWVAQIQKNGTHYFLGHYPTRWEAAAAYERAALKVHGKFARPETRTEIATGGAKQSHLIRQKENLKDASTTERRNAT